METQKMGAFIRELRKEQQMTQKNLAEKLHITDRAVSKWERGLNAPDLATLEPLAEILGVTITELIAGERAEKQEEDLKAVLAYSAEQTAALRRARRRVLAMALGILVLGTVMLGALLWTKGVFDLVQRSVSPDGTVTVAIYDRDLVEHPFSKEPRLTVREERPGDLEYTAIYGGTFAGLWWAPDSNAYVLSMEGTEGPRTLLVREGSTTELDAWLRLAVGEAGLDFDSAGTRYRFCQWAEDGRNLLIHYQTEREAGYFWCDVESGAISGLFGFSC